MNAGSSLLFATLIAASTLLMVPDAHARQCLKHVSGNFDGGAKVEICPMDAAYTDDAGVLRFELSVDGGDLYEFHGDQRGGVVNLQVGDPDNPLIDTSIWDADRYTPDNP